MTRPVIEAVIFDWGGTLTPWHTVEARDPWAAYIAAAGLPAAAGVGMRTILLPHSTIPLDQQVTVDAEPDAVIDGLDEVRGIVAAWRAGSTPLGHG